MVFESNQEVTMAWSSPFAQLEIGIKRLSPLAVIPKFQTSGSSGLDLCSIEEVVLAPGERKLIRTGLALCLPNIADMEAQIRPRSGLALKHGITVLNAPGTIDSDYRGELGVLLINHGQESVEFKCGDRIAQLVFGMTMAHQLPIKEVFELPDSERGVGGFGSTGRS